MRTTFVRRTQPPRGVRTWWGKAWQRAVEEATYSEAELRPGRTHARRGDVGGITVDAGTVVAAVRDGEDAWTVEVAVPVLDDDARRAFVDVVAAESGRVAELLSANLPHDLVEHAEEVGVELLPYGGELAATCTCPHYLDPCAHAVAVLLQVGWLVDEDPLVLLAVRGLDREGLLAALHARTADASRERGAAVVGELADDVELAVDAALRARAMIAAFEDDDQAPR